MSWQTCSRAGRDPLTSDAIGLLAGAGGQLGLAGREQGWHFAPSRDSMQKES
jgi:hypothetical protein